MLILGSPYFTQTYLPLQLRTNLADFFAPLLQRGIGVCFDESKLPSHDMYTTMLFFNLVLATALAPSPLTSSMLAGNVNFDPLGLAATDLRNPSEPRTPEELLDEYRESELRHGRLAMLAAVAYPTQEKLNPVLSDMFEAPNLLPLSKLSPSLLNGGLNSATLIVFLGLASAVELGKMNVQSDIPGDFGWRLTASHFGTSEFVGLQEGEIWNGRLAMVAVLGYVVQEAVTKTPVLF